MSLQVLFEILSICKYEKGMNILGVCFLSSFAAFRFLTQLILNTQSTSGSTFLAKEIDIYRIIAIRGVSKKDYFNRRRKEKSRNGEKPK
jgi:hypothetical protein